MGGELKALGVAQVRREKREAEERLTERGIIEQELKSESSKLAGALAACQVAHEAALARAADAAKAREAEAQSAAHSGGYREGWAAGEAAALRELEESKVSALLALHPFYA